MDSYSRSNLNLRESSASQRADGQCGELQGSGLASGLTIRFLVVTAERARMICQQPGLSQLPMSLLGPIPKRSVPRHSPAPTTSAGEIQGIALKPPEQQFGSINAAVLDAVSRVFALAQHAGCPPLSDPALFDMPDLSRWLEYSTRPLPSWTAVKFTRLS